MEAKNKENEELKAQINSISKKNKDNFEVGENVIGV